MRFAEFVRNSGSPVAYYPRLAIALGGVNEAVFVCQLLYWEGKQSNPQRWIHKSVEEVRAETGLSRCEQDGVRRTLESAGILESRYERLVHRLYFRVDLGRLGECWEAEYPSEEKIEDTDFPRESGKTTFGKTETKPVISPANVEKPVSGMWKNHIRIIEQRIQQRIRRRRARMSKLGQKIPEPENCRRRYLSLLSWQMNTD
jgi:hypothetical protein